MRKLTTTLCLVCAMPIIAGWSAQVSAVPQTQLLRATQTEHGDDALSTLAAKLQKCIVLEGRATVDEVIGAYHTATVQSKTDPRKQIEALAAGLDCTVSEQNGVLLLQRRYTTFNALPTISYTEAQATSRTITQLLNTYDTRIILADAKNQDGTYAYRFIRSLRDIDKAKLHDGILLSSLTEEQQKECRLLNRFTYFQGDVEKHAIHEADMNGVSTKSAVFFLRSLGKANTTVFGFEYRGAEGSLQQRPLSTPMSSYIRGSRSYSPLLGYNANSNDADGALLAEMALPDVGVQPRFLQSETLEQLCERLSNTDGSTGFSVDKILQRRTVTIAGMQFADPISVARAAATVSQLRLIHTSDKPQNHYHLVGLNPRADDEQQIVQAVHDAIPATLWRTIAHQPLPPLKMPSNRPEPDFLIAERYEEQDRKRLSQLRAAIVKQLRTIVEPILRSDTQTLPVAEAGDTARDLLGLLLLLDMMETSRSFPKHQIPDSISDYNKLYLSCGTMRDGRGNPIIDVSGKYTYQLLFGPKKETIHSAVSMIIRVPTSKLLD